MIDANVKEIKNVFVIDGEEEKKVNTMKDMYYVAHLKGLFEEIANALNASNSLEELEAKN